MAPQFNASTIVSDDNFVIPFPGSLSTPERRKTLCVGRLPFRPRRASDYDWLGDLANDPLDVFLWHPFLLSRQRFLLCWFAYHWFWSMAGELTMPVYMR